MLESRSLFRNWRSLSSPNLSLYYYADEQPNSDFAESLQQTVKSKYCVRTSMKYYVTGLKDGGGMDRSTVFLTFRTLIPMMAAKAMAKAMMIDVITPIMIPV